MHTLTRPALVHDHKRTYARTHVHTHICGVKATNYTGGFIAANIGAFVADIRKDKTFDVAYIVMACIVMPIYYCQVKVKSSVLNSNQ